MTKNNGLLAKNQRKNILHNLEILYENRLIQYDVFKRVQAPKWKKTNVSKVDRRYRSEIKSCEILLHLMGSKLFDHAKPPSIRRTFELEARHNLPV